MAIDQLEMLQQETPPPDGVDLSWLRSMSDWGIHARGGKRGLTLDEINIGPYGDVPEASSGQTMRPRGATARLCTFLTEVEFIAGNTSAQ